MTDTSVDRGQGAGDGKGHAYKVVHRDKGTRRGVIIGDYIANWGITIGGLLVILAVVGIMVFLVRVAVPLIGGSDEVAAPKSYRVDPPKQVAWLNGDEYKTLAARIAADGAVSAFHVPTGRLVAQADLGFGGSRATAVAGVLSRDQVAFGFADGTIRFGEVDFDIAVVRAGDVTGVPTQLDERDWLLDGTVYSTVPGGQMRRVALSTAIREPEAISDSAIVAIDYRVGGTTERPTRSFVTVDAAGVGRISRAETQVNLLTGAETVRVRTSTLPGLAEGTEVTGVVMTSQADMVVVSTADGRLLRYDTRNFEAPTLAETRRVFPDGVEVTAMTFLNGELGLVVGGSNGAVDVFFRLQRPGAATVDGYELVRGRSHEPHAAPVVAIDVSQRSKALVTMDEAGSVWVRHSTSDQVLARFPRSGDVTQDSTLVLLPRNDGVLLVGDDGAADYWSFKFPHPEVTTRTVFGKVWYEGYSEPTLTWQSSSGTDIFEPKFSLVPLIFGTIKATVYALLFALPIALMGAIYTSEFVHRRVRATIKPVMEMMESLPTVVLGFVAALILAPIVETWISAVLLAFVALPLGLMVAAYLWQSLPPATALRYDGVPKFLFMFVVIAVSVYLAYLLGPVFERLLFGGDFKGWVNGDHGSGLPFLFLIGLPLAFVLAGMGFDRTVGYRYRQHLRSLPRQQAGLLELARWLAMLAAAALISILLSYLLVSVGYDPRGGVVDTYVQRNALVVGFVMGFAVIPNIYTLAEDALNSVPNHLRSASLAAGATPWQTAKWVILPTAMSGVFAAVMIGMGRAVGETMIVVMAAGNTPVLDWNIFNGLRTLSANIAVELPEAVKDGSLYRMLFLAALTLFVMTFAINTLAEIIRQRFRKRAFQL